MFLVANTRTEACTKVMSGSAKKRLCQAGGECSRPDLVSPEHSKHGITDVGHQGENSCGPGREATPIETQEMVISMSSTPRASFEDDTRPPSSSISIKPSTTCTCGWKPARRRSRNRQLERLTHLNLGCTSRPEPDFLPEIGLAQNCVLHTPRRASNRDRLGSRELDI